MSITKTSPIFRYREYSSHTDKPLLIYLHGAGERGDNPSVIDRVSFVKSIVAQHKDKFTILAPQQPATSWSWGWHEKPEEHRAVNFIKWAQENYQHDGRTFVTGHSMGGHGTWDVATLMGDKITGAVVSAGRSDFYQGVVALGALGTPIKHFHGDKDTSENSYSKGKSVTGWYKQKSGKDVLITYKGADHPIDGKVYGEENIAEWFLSLGVSNPPVPDPEPEPTPDEEIKDQFVYDGKLFTITDKGKYQAQLTKIE